MATYKVLQDIEAEDKLVGPLTLRQCIYAAIAILAGYLSFIVISKGVPFVAIIFLPFVIFGAFFAIPWSKQQSTEVWALAKIRFALKPRRRIWNQSGVKDLVTVTAPKKIEAGPYVRDISQTEVQSRLKALADTIDSRGWAVKNVAVDAYQQPYTFEASTDRLVDASSFPQPVPDTTTTASDDMFDMANNPIAQQFGQKISAAETAHKQQLVSAMNNPVQAQAAAPTGAQDYWYLTQPTTDPAQVISSSAEPMNASWQQLPQAATPTPEEEALAQEIKRKQELYDNPHTASHIKTIQPLSHQPSPSTQPPLSVQVAQQIIAQQAAAQSATDATAAATPVLPASHAAEPPVTTTPSPAILDLANNNDLDVATIAREAQRNNPDAAGEVVVKLH